MLEAILALLPWILSGASFYLLWAEHTRKRFEDSEAQTQAFSAVEPLPLPPSPVVTPSAVPSLAIPEVQAIAASPTSESLSYPVASDPSSPTYSASSTPLATPRPARTSSESIEFLVKTSENSLKRNLEAKKRLIGSKASLRTDDNDGLEILRKEVHAVLIDTFGESPIDVRDCSNISLLSALLSASRRLHARTQEAEDRVENSQRVVRSSEQLMREALVRAEKAEIETEEVKSKLQSIMRNDVLEPLSSSNGSLMAATQALQGLMEVLDLVVIPAQSSRSVPSTPSVSSQGPTFHPPKTLSHHLWEVDETESALLAVLMDDLNLAVKLAAGASAAVETIAKFFSRSPEVLQIEFPLIPTAMANANLQAQLSVADSKGTVRDREMLNVMRKHKENTTRLEEAERSLKNLREMADDATVAAEEAEEALEAVQDELRLAREAKIIMEEALGVTDSTEHGMLDLATMLVEAEASASRVARESMATMMALAED